LFSSLTRAEHRSASRPALPPEWDAALREDLELCIRLPVKRTSGPTPGPGPAPAPAAKELLRRAEARLTLVREAPASGDPQLLYYAGVIVGYSQCTLRQSKLGASAVAIELAQKAERIKRALLKLALQSVKPQLEATVAQALEQVRQPQQSGPVLARQAIQQLRTTWESQEISQARAQARCAMNAGRPDEAATALKRMLGERAKRASKDSDELLGVWEDLYRALANDPGQALPYIRKCIAATEKARRADMPESSANVALSMHYRALAIALHKLGRTDEAKRAARTALDKSDGFRPPGAGILTAASETTAVGVAQRAIASTQLAIEQRNRALRRILGERPATADLANVFALESELREAVEDGRTREAFAALELLAGGLNQWLDTNEPIGESFTFLLGLLPTAEAATLPLMQRAPDPSLIALGFYVTANRQGRAFDEIAHIASRATQLDPSKVAEARRKRSQRAARYLQTLAAQTGARDRSCEDDGGIDRALKSEDEAQHELEMTAYRGMEIKARSKAKKQALRLAAITIPPRAQYQEFKRAVQAHLGPNEVLINFVRSAPLQAIPNALESSYAPARYYAFALRATGEVELNDLGVASAIDTAVVQLRDDVLSEAAEAVEHAADELGRLILAPLAASLHGAGHAYLVPDGRLQHVPFDALRVGGVVAIERHRFTHLSSARELALLRRWPLKPPPLSAVTFAVPRIKRAEVAWFRDEKPSELRGVVQEIERLSQMLKGASVQNFAGEQADERAFLQTASPTILHFGGHGVFIGNDYERIAPSTESAARGFAPAANETGSLPAQLSFDLPLMHTALLVAPARGEDRDSYDNLVTSYEIARMDLKRTELVVLGACDTANGFDVASQGIASLRRAFTMAGAKTVLATLWPVADTSTAALMTEFYGRILRGEGRSVALHEAKLALREKYPHPRHWAGVTLSGATGPLPVLPGAVPAVGASR
jgi:CHAT domain-containing protein